LGTNASIVSPITRSFVLSGVGDTPDSGISLNGPWTINGPISGPGGLMVNGWVRNDGGGVPQGLGIQIATLTLAGSNSYGGDTTINYGNLVATGGSAIPDASAVLISTRSVWGGNAGSATTTFNNAVLRVDASETIGSLAGGTAVRGVVNINGPAVTLTTGVDDTSTIYDGGITGTGSLTKEGAGTFAMNGTKSYLGDTRVLDGVLSTNSASLADLANVYLTSGSMLDLNFIGIDTIDGLFIDGLQRRGGIWGAPGSGAPRTTASISGTGFLQVTSVPEPGTFIFALIATAGLLIRRATARAARR
jgi:autotransporter-associated beta strand protein